VGGLGADRIYDEITEHAEEYYLYNAELGLFKRFGGEIARAMAFPSGREGGEGEEVRHAVETGWDVVELGAGCVVSLFWGRGGLLEYSCGVGS
jgi:hypothetical protein